MIKNLLIYMKHPHVGAWNFKPEHRELLQRLVPDLDITVCYSSKDFFAWLPEAEAVFVWFFEEEWLDSAPNLRLIATPAAGTEWINVKPRW